MNKTLERSTNVWCVHTANDEHLAALVYDGDSRWSLIFEDANGNETKAVFNAADIEEAKTKVDDILIEEKVEPRDEPHDGPFVLTGASAHGYFSHQMDGLYTLARTLAALDVFFEEVLDALALAIADLQPTIQEAATEETIKGFRRRVAERIAERQRDDPPPSITHLSPPGKPH